MRPTTTAAAQPYRPRETLLKNRAARSGSFGVHGRAAVTLGGLLVTTPIVAMALAGGEIIVRPLATWNVRWWLAAYMTAFVVTAGLAVLVHGVRDLRRAARVERRRAANAHQPWQWDYEWNPHGIRDDDAMRRARQLMGIGTAMFILLMPLQLLALAGISGGVAEVPMLVPFSLITVLFQAVAVAVVASGARIMQRQLKYGRGSATFARFPFRVGQEIELQVHAPPALPRQIDVTATLRCVQERYITTTTSDRETRTNVQCFELYRDTAPAEQVVTEAGTGALRVRFTIPADAPTTELSSRPCRYWEVDVEAATDGVDYAARFLVPVY